MGTWGKFKAQISIVIICFSILACQGSGGGGSGAPTDGGGLQPKPDPSSAEGILFGQAWKYLSGRADYVNRSGKKFWVVTLYSRQYSNPCNEVDGSDQQVRIQFRDWGSWAIDPNDPFVRVPSIVFVDFNRQDFFRGNVVANSGVITAKLNSDNPNANFVYGYAYGAFRPSNVGDTQITGSFSVPVCTRVQ